MRDIAYDILSQSIEGKEDGREYKHKERKYHKQAEDFLRSGRFLSLRKSTKDQYRSVLFNSFFAFLDETDCESIEEHTAQKYCDGYVDALEKAGNSIVSVKGKARIVKTFIKWVGINTIDLNPVYGTLIKHQPFNVISRYFSDEDILKMQRYPFYNKSEVANIRSRLIIQMLIDTGIKITEMASLEWAHVDIASKTFWIVNGNITPRPAFLSQRACDLMEKYMDNIEHAKKNVFDCELKTIINTVNACIGDCGLQTGIASRDAYTFRTYFATNLYCNGDMPLDMIAYLLGEDEKHIKNKLIHPWPSLLRERIYKTWEKRFE